MSGPDSRESTRAPTAATSARERRGPTWIAVGALLGERYEVLELLGEGAEGSVVAVRDLRADAVVALKLIDESALDAARVARLRRELSLARRVVHAGIVRTHDLVAVPGYWALSMERIVGEPLSARLIRDAPLPAAQLLRLASELSSALGAAHGAGVTHRDLKPSNIMIRAVDGSAVITDFGIARGEADVELRTGAQPPSVGSVTRTGAIVGTPRYMAPEQLRGEPATPASDVYALGLVLYEAATGRLDCDADTVDRLLDARTGPVPSVSRLRPGLPGSLAELIDRCRSPDPTDRPSDGAGVARALARRRRPLRAMALAGGLVGVALAIAAARSVGRAPAAEHAIEAPPRVGRILSPHNPRRVTFGTCEEHPSFSPDGRRLVFDRKVGDAYHVFVRDLDDGSEVQLTELPGWSFAATVSPEGGEVAFLHYAGGQAQASRVPLGGGKVERIHAGALVPSYTPAGDAIWAGDRARPERIARDDGSVTEVLEVPSPHRVHQLAELGDGTILALMPLQNGGGLLRFGPAPERAHQWLYRGNLEMVLSVDEMRAVALIAEILPTGHTRVLAVPLAGGPTEPAPAGIAPSKGLSLSRDGRRVAWSTCRGIRSLFALTDGTGTAPLRKATDWEDIDAAPIPGSASEVVVLSSRSGRIEPWRVDVDDRHAPTAIGLSRSVTDGVDFVAVTAAGDDLALVDSAGTLWLRSGAGALRRLASGALLHAPAFVDEGVVFGVGPASAPRLSWVPLRGGPAKPWLAASGQQPASDGELVVYLERGLDERATPMLRRAAADPEPLTPELGPAVYGHPGISAALGRAALPYGGDQVVEVDLATRAVVARHAIEHGPAYRTLYAGSRLLVVAARWEGNVWLADDPFGPDHGSQ